MAELPCPLARRFAALARRDGVAAALLTASGSVSRTRAQLLAGAEETAAHLPVPTPPAPALVSLPNSPELVEAFLALRLCETPVALVDATATAEELRRCADAVGASLIVARPEQLEGLPRRRSGAGLAAAAHRPAVPVRLPPRTAFLKMTSGSTGVPRAVALTARQAAADAAQILRTMGVRSGDVTLAAIPLTHSYGFGSCLIPLLLTGLPLLFPASSLPADLLSPLARAGVAHFPAVPAMIRALAALEDAPALGHLRVCLSAGAPLRVEDAAAFQARCGVGVNVFYGASECGGIAYHRAQAPRAGSGEVGAALYRVRIDILDDTGEVLPAGREGRVRVTSPAVATGLLGDGEEPCPLRGRSFLTSDLGTLDAEGRLTLTGRVTALVNVAGKKVHPDEVRRVLEDLPKVRAAAVLGLPDTHRGELIAAVVAADPTLGLTVQEVLAHCRARLAPHKVPRRLVIVEELPVSERGKVPRAALLDLIAGEKAIADAGERGHVRVRGVPGGRS
jgi:acyl-CoA synthetase (AMP-forming)/AMP-acid ligase II